MPTVPRLEGRKVLAEPMPAARVSISADEETFGGGASSKAIVAGAEQLNTTLQTSFAKHKEAADEVKVQDAVNMLQNGTTDASGNKILGTTDILAKISQMKGQNAIGSKDEKGNLIPGAVDTAKSDYAALKSYVTQNLDQGQKALFAKHDSQAYTELYAKATFHTTNQISEHDNKSSELRFTNLQNQMADNIRNEKAFNVLKSGQEDAINQYAKRNGLFPEEITALKEKVSDGNHIKILQSLVRTENKDDIKLATKYYKKYGDQIIDKTQRKEIWDYIEKATNKVDARDIAVKMFSTAKTPSDVADTINKIQSDDLKKEVAKQYTVMRKNQYSTWNKIEADVSERSVAANPDGTPAYTAADLENDRGIVSPEFYQTMRESLNTVDSQYGIAIDMSKPGGQELLLAQNGTYSALLSEWTKISSGPPDEITDKMMSWRREVISKKAIIGKGFYERLVKMSSEKYVAGLSDKIDQIRGSAMSIESFFDNTGYPDKDKALAQFMSNVHSMKKEDIPEATRALIDEYKAKNNPNFVKYKGDGSEKVITPTGVLKITGFDDDGEPVGEYV
jgi:hypothetical protein